MSSILEALKKLETDSIEKENSPFLWTHPVNLKSSLDNRLQNRSLYKFVLFRRALIFFSVITIILLFIIFLQKNYRNKTEPVKTMSAKKTDINISPQIVVEKNKEGVSTYLVVEPAKAPLLKAQKADIKKNTQLKKEEKIYGIAKKSVFKDGINKKPAKKFAFKDEINKKPAKKSAFKNGINKKPAKKVDGKWLKLHGISWSDNPARRMAVINSMIVREGKTIEGAHVVRIDKKYVVIEKDGEELLLSFGQY